MTRVNTLRLARDLAREYLDEPDNDTADALGRRLARLARGSAIVVDDQVILPHPSGRLAVYPAWDLEADAAELAALASGARPTIRPLLPDRVARARQVTDCTVEEAWRIVEDMDRVGFAGEDDQFITLARAILARNRAMEADPARVLDPRD